MRTSYHSVNVDAEQVKNVLSSDTDKNRQLPFNCPESITQYQLSSYGPLFSYHDCYVLLPHGHSKLAHVVVQNIMWAEDGNILYYKKWKPWPKQDTVFHSDGQATLCN